MEVKILDIALCEAGTIDVITDWHRAEWGDEWAEQIQDFSKNGGLPGIYVALLDGKTPIGTSMLVFDDMVTRTDLGPWLGGVYVLPEYRDHGVGTELTRHAMDKARELELPVLWLYTAKARHLYERLGWKFVSEEYYPVESQNVSIMKWESK